MKGPWKKADKEFKKLESDAGTELKKLGEDVGVGLKKFGEDVGAGLKKLGEKIPSCSPESPTGLSTNRERPDTHRT